MREFISKYGRIVLLAVLVSVSLLVLFGVIGGGASGSEVAVESTQSSITELQFGIDLSGGTRITAPLYGYTAEEVKISEDADTAQIERDIADNLDGARAGDVLVRLQFTNQGEPDSIIEVTSKDVTRDEFESAVSAAGYSDVSIRKGVSESTREQTVEVINDKINAAGLSGGTARTTQSATGEYFVLIEVPGEDRENVRDVLSDRGSVRVDLYYSDFENGDEEYVTDEAVLTQESFQRVGTPTRTDGLGPHVPVTLQRSAAEDFRTATTDAGMVPSGSACRYDVAPEDTGPCLLTVVDGEVVYSAGMSPSLANSIGNGQWVEDPTFVLQTSSLEEARELSLHLSAGQLPTAVNFDAGSSSFISSTQGQQFITSGLLIGILSIIGVGIKVYLSYGDARVAAPMIITSLCEVIILLGFAALVGYPIDLAVIGGFVAVIGTGVDDLIIIANEVLSDGGVSSQTVFDSRFSKAFWVIMAAAGTTALALSPLIILSLGQLQGFAIFTIVGIGIGVFITRPAYGDVLNHILVDEKTRRKK